MSEKLSRATFRRSYPEMPLFLTPDRHVDVPLDSSYAIAYHGVPQRWRRVIEGTE